MNQPAQSPSTRGPAKRAAAFFDLDKTIIARSSTLAFSRSFYDGGLLTRRAVLRSAYANFMFGAQGASHDQLERMRAYLTDLVTGWDVAAVRKAVNETLETIINPLVYDEAVELIEGHRAAGRDVVIISASGSEVVEPIGRLLGADHTIATTLVEANGRYTGEVDFYAYGPNKAVAMVDLARRFGYDLAASYAYSDSETDAPMLEAVGFPFAVNPDKALRKIAEEAAWPILVFGNPVSMRSRLGLGGPVARVTLAAAVGGVMVTVAIATMRSRRRRYRDPGVPASGEASAARI